MTQVWAHRGASGYVPENTLEAFAKAVEMKADGIELDVQFSKDGEVVVIHDETLQRVSDGTGYVRDYTLAELKGFNFSKTISGYARTQIPTLREVLELIRDTGLLINIELKTGVFPYEGIEEKTIALVEEYGMQERIWYSSFNHFSVMKVKELRPDAKCGVLYGNGSVYKAAKYAKMIGVEAIHPAIGNLKYPGIYDECREEGIRLHTWTVNTTEQFDQCWRLGIDAMITNYPDKARTFVSQ